MNFITIIATVIVLQLAHLYFAIPKSKNDE